MAVEHMGGRWQLVTFTVAHRSGMQLKRLVTGIMKAIRRMKQGGAVQRLWGEKVTASVRTLEVLYGDENGWHPHVHMLVRTSEWDWQDKLTLLHRWQDCVSRELGEECRPSDIRGVWWSEPFEGSVSANRSLYVTKLGLEVAGVGKTGKLGNLTPWGLAEKAAEESGRNEWSWGKYQRLWREYIVATKGRRMIEMDDRMAEAARKAKEEKALEKLEAREANGRDQGEERFASTRIQVKRDDVRALRMLENGGKHWVFAAVLSAAEENGERGVVAWLTWARAKTQPTPREADPGVRAAGGAGCAALF